MPSVNLFIIKASLATIIVMFTTYFTLNHCNHILYKLILTVSKTQTIFHLPTLLFSTLTSNYLIIQITFSNFLNESPNERKVLMRNWSGHELCNCGIIVQEEDSTFFDECTLLRNWCRALSLFDNYITKCMCTSTYAVQ